MNVFSNVLSKRNMVDKIEVDNNQCEVKYGDVFFTISSEVPEEVGMSSVWLHNFKHIYLNSFCFGFRPTIDIEYLFLAFLFRNNTFRKNVRILAQGVSRYNISKWKTLEIKLLIPSLPEQTKIGKLFNKLENLANLYTFKISKLKTIKQSLLKAMFV